LSEEDTGVQRVSEGVGVQPARMLKVEVTAALAQNPGSPLICVVLLTVNHKRGSMLAKSSAEELPRLARG